MHSIISIISRLFSSRTSPEDMATAKALILQLIEENGVVVFGKSWCGFCIASRQLLKSLGAKYIDINLDSRGMCIVTFTFLCYIPKYLSTFLFCFPVLVVF